MKAVFGADEIPKEGITAGDLKMAMEPKGPTGPEPESVQGPQGPVSPEMILADIYKRLDQQGTLLVQIADRIIAPPNQMQTTGSAPVSIMGIPIGQISDIIGVVRQSLGGGGGANDIYYTIGKRVVDGTVDSAVKRLISSGGAEAARHVSG